MTCLLSLLIIATLWIPGLAIVRDCAPQLRPELRVCLCPGGQHPPLLPRGSRRLDFSGAVSLDLVDFDRRLDTGGTCPAFHHASVP